MRVFCDSSAFAKRYISEAGTDELLRWCDRADEMGLSIVALPELFSAFNRLRREQRLSDGQYHQIKSDLLADISDVSLCDMTPQVVGKTLSLLEMHTLRGMDAIHLAAAIAWQAEVFLSSDARQCAAARASGLRVVAV